MAGRWLGCRAARMAARTSAKANGPWTDGTNPARTAPVAPPAAPAAGRPPARLSRGAAPPPPLALQAAVVARVMAFATPRARCLAVSRVRGSPRAPRVIGHSRRDGEAHGASRCGDGPGAKPASALCLVGERVRPLQIRGDAACATRSAGGSDMAVWRGGFASRFVALLTCATTLGLRPLRSFGHSRNLARASASRT